MIYEARNYFDGESALVADAETALGLGDVREPFFEHISRLQNVIETATPTNRTLVLQHFAARGEYSFWEISAYQTGDVESVEAEPALSDTVRSALLDYVRTKQEYATQRKTVEEKPGVRQALLNGVESCRQHIDEEAIKREAQDSAEDFKSLQDSLDVLTAIEENNMADGYELEIMKRHFYKTIKTLEFRGLFKSKAHDTKIPEKQWVNFLREKYQVFVESPTDVIKSEVDLFDQGENPIFIDDGSPEDYFYVYLNDLRESKRLSDESLYKKLLGPTEVPRHHARVEKAKDELKIKGSVPERLDPDALFEFLDSKIPDAMLGVCRVIDFRRFSYHEAIFRDEAGEDTGRLYGGLWYSFGKAEINIGAIKTPNRLREVVTHEIGHGVLEALTINDLFKFEMARQSDPVHITDYVEFNEEHFPDRTASEDFAESFSMYFTNPKKLKELSPSRFNVIEEIVEDFRKAIEPVGF